MDNVQTIGLIVTIVSTLLCPVIAYAKGRSVVGWFFGGFFLGGLGFIIICCLSDKTESQEETSEGDKKENSGD